MVENEIDSTDKRLSYTDVVRLSSELRVGRGSADAVTMVESKAWVDVANALET